jgi:hypothetical protein
MDAVNDRFMSHMNAIKTAGSNHRIGNFSKMIEIVKNPHKFVVKPR